MDWPTSTLGIVTILCLTRVWLNRARAADFANADRRRVIQLSRVVEKLAAAKSAQNPPPPSVPPMPPLVTDVLGAGPSSQVFGASCNCIGCRAVRSFGATDE